METHGRPSPSSSPSTTRLFHTIVMVGIALGVSTGCGSIAISPEEQDATDTPESSSSSSGIIGDAASPDAIDAAFCDVPWPTTKGNTTVMITPLPACVDPAVACDKQLIGEVGPCVVAKPDGCMLGPERELEYPNCRAEKTWVCPPNTVSQQASPTGPCSCPGEFLGQAQCKSDGASGNAWLP